MWAASLRPLLLGLGPRCQVVWLRECRAGGRGFASTVEPDFSSTDPYRVLGVTRAAGAAEVKAQYYRLAKVYHPDVSGGDDEIFKRLKQAYDTVVKQAGLPPGEAYDKKQEMTWEEMLRKAAEASRPPPPSSAPPKPPQALMVDFLQIRQWYILSSGLRSPADNQLFQKLVKQWALLAQFDRAVQGALGGGTDQLFFCDDKEKAFWLTELEALRKAWKASHSEVLKWADARHSELQKARESMHYEALKKAAQEFDGRFGWNVVRKQAYEDFEKVKMDLMTKRSNTIGAEDEW
eukprot:RCo028979